VSRHHHRSLVDPSRERERRKTAEEPGSHGLAVVRGGAPFAIRIVPGLILVVVAAWAGAAVDLR
jgi:hypothetical protein